MTKTQSGVGKNIPGIKQKSTRMLGPAAIQTPDSSEVPSRLNLWQGPPIITDVAGDDKGQMSPTLLIIHL